MKIIESKDRPIAPNPHKIDARMIVDREDIALVELNLKPGDSLKPHITHADVTFYVIEGKGIVTVGEESEEVHKGQYIESPEGIVHLWENNSDSPLVVMVMKTPRPKAKTKVL